MMTNKNILDQQGLFSNQRRFEIKDDRYLYVQMKGVKQEKTYLIDLVALEPQSRRKFTIAWPWVIAAGVVLLLLFLVTQIIPSLFDINLGEYVLIITISMSLLAFIFLILAISKSCLERVFVARNTGFPLARLFTNNPDRSTFRAFIKQLESVIEDVYQKIPIDDQQRLAGEVKMLRRLVNHNVLTSQEYENLKTQLMAMSNSA